MAAPTLGLLNHTEIDDADTNASWLTLTTPDPDILKEGTNSMSGVFRANGTVGYYDDATARTIAGKHLRVWVNTTNAAYMQPESSGGYELYVYDGSTTNYYTIFGSDTYAGGWFNVVVDCELFATVTDANVVRWGIRCNHTSNAKNVTNMWIDFFRYSDGYYLTGGTSGDKVRLVNVALADKGTSPLLGYGIVLESEEVYFGYGKIQIGNGATTTYFEMDGDVLVFTDKPVADGLYAINGNGAGANIVITNSTIKASGTGAANRPDINMSSGSPGYVAITDTVIIRGGLITLGSGQVITGNTFNDCQQIITNGANISGSAVVDSVVAADTGAVYQNVAYTDTYLDGMQFEMGAASHHAIDFGTAVTSDLTLRNIDFTGFGSTGDANDSTVRFLATSGSLTLNLIGCTVNGVGATTSNFSVDDAAGITVTVSIAPVDLEITVQDITTGSPIENAQTLVWVSDGTNFPYLDSVTIISSGTTATVTHTGHGLITGDDVIIQGADQEAYNGAFEITYISDNSYSYTMPESATSPATGTILSTFAYINEDSNASGICLDTRSIGADQDIQGWARKHDSSPYYQQGVISGTVNKDSGYTQILQLVRDE